MFHSLEQHSFRCDLNALNDFRIKIHNTRAQQFSCLSTIWRHLKPHKLSYLLSCLAPAADLVCLCVCEWIFNSLSFLSQMRMPLTLAIKSNNVLFYAILAHFVNMKWEHKYGHGKENENAKKIENRWMAQSGIIMFGSDNDTKTDEIIALFMSATAFQFFAIKICIHTVLYESFFLSNSYVFIGIRQIISMSLQYPEVEITECFEWKSSRKKTQKQ